MVVRRIRKVDRAFIFEYAGSPETEAKELEALNWQWKRKTFSRRELYQAYLGSKYWARIRRKILKRDRGACVLCGSCVGVQVDHKVSPMIKDTLGEEVASNLQTLCYVCHSKKTVRYDMRANSYHRSLDESEVGKKEQLFELLREGKKYDAGRTGAGEGEDRDVAAREEE